MSAASAKHARRVRHNNRKRGVYKLTRQRYILPIALLATLCALFVHLGILHVAPSLYKLWAKHFGPEETPDYLQIKEEENQVIVHIPKTEEYREVEEQPPPPEPTEPEVLEPEPEEIDVLDLELQDLVMAPVETVLPLPEPEEDELQQSDTEVAELAEPSSLEPALLGTSDMPSQDEFIPEPTPMNTNSIVIQATAQSEVLQDADGVLEAEMRRMAREGGGEDGGSVTLKELITKRNLGKDSGVAQLRADVLFDFDKSTLKPAARIPLLTLAALIHKNPNTRFIIEGHTDSFGTAEYNALLSLQRAAAVCRWLAGNSVPVDKVYIRACGNSRPIVDIKGTKDEQQENRRVEIHMRSPEEDLPPNSLPATYEVDCITPVRTQLKRGVRAPLAAEK